MAKNKRKKVTLKSKKGESCRSNWDWIHQGRFIRKFSTFIPISDDHDDNDDFLKNLER